MDINDEALNKAFDELHDNTKEADDVEVEVETEEKEEKEETPELWKPSSWKEDELQEWEAAPEHIRKAVERREREMTRFMEESAPRRKLAETFEQTTSRYADILEQAGIDPMSAYDESLQLYKILRSDDESLKRQAINHIAQTYGVKLDAKDEPSDPITSAIRQELQGIKSELGNWKQQQAEAQQMEAAAQIESFAKGKQHFEQVRYPMGQLIEAGIATDLNDAYDKALKLTGLSENKVTQAKKAASTNVDPKGAASAEKGKPKNWQDGLDSVYDEVVNT